MNFVSATVSTSELPNGPLYVSEHGNGDVPETANELGFVCHQIKCLFVYLPPN